MLSIKQQTNWWQRHVCVSVRFNSDHYEMVGKWIYLWKWMVYYHRYKHGSGNQNWDYTSKI